MLATSCNHLFPAPWVSVCSPRPLRHPHPCGFCFFLLPAFPDFSIRLPTPAPCNPSSHPLSSISLSLSPSRSLSESLFGTSPRFLSYLQVRTLLPDPEKWPLLLHRSPAPFLWTNIVTTMTVDHPCCLLSPGWISLCLLVDGEPGVGGVGFEAVGLAFTPSPPHPQKQREGKSSPIPLLWRRPGSLGNPANADFSQGSCRSRRGLGNCMPGSIVMATRSLVGPGLCSQAGEVAPQCVSLVKPASEGRAAPGKQTGLRQQAFPVSHPQRRTARWEKPWSPDSGIR